jgi:hypothetical protein
LRKPKNGETGNIRLKTEERRQIKPKTKKISNTDSNVNANQARSSLYANTQLRAHRRAEKKIEQKK